MPERTTLMKRFALSAALMAPALGAFAAEQFYATRSKNEADLKFCWS